LIDRRTSLLKSSRETGSYTKLLLFMLLALTSGGCIQAAMAFGPLGLRAVEAVGIGTANEVTGHKVEGDDENDDDRCAQLAAAQPYVAEVRSRADGGIELRQREIKELSHASQWTIVAPSPPSDVDGWRIESNIRGLNFDPPLDSLLNPGNNYLVSVPLTPANRFETDQQLSFVLIFGPRSGTYRWGDRRYEYRVTDKLPCFPLALR
jgi:hypothetical protein